MRVAVFAESFLPHMNGVTHSLLQILRHFETRGDEVLVVAPDGGPVDHTLHGASAAFLRSVALPSYPQVRLAFASARRLEGMLAGFGPDVVHLASPFVLGWQGLRAAERLGIASVAVYQTDVPGYAARYGVPGAEPVLARHVSRIHQLATLTLTPSSAAAGQLTDAGVERIRHWARGVDTARFHPARRSDRFRRLIAPGGELVVGYVGRLAPEKQLEDLRVLRGLPGIRLVIVGDGPSRAALERELPDAAFCGFLGGDALAEAVASFDLFVHPGESESFCQTIQEALASGVPVVSTGRGGPVDLVQNSRTGWLYPPGELGVLREKVLDLTGDAAKRRAFGVAARASVEGRSWERLGDELVGHYREAIALRRAGRVRLLSLAPREPEVPARSWSRYVAVGDSLTEGLCDDSRQVPGEYRGWADRLASLLAHERSGEMLYANLAVRSRRIDDVLEEQLPRAQELGADLVSILIGGNDLVKRGADPARLAERLGAGVLPLRAGGADVLLVTPFAPPYRSLGRLHRRIAVFNRRLREHVAGHGVRIVDFWSSPEFLDPRMWAADRVHLSAHGHRLLSYRAASALGVPHADALGSLDAGMHAEGAEALTTPAWLWTHVRPWLARRARGLTAGDGRSPKYAGLVRVGRTGSESHSVG